MKQNTFPMGNKELPEKFRPIIDYASKVIMSKGIGTFTVEKLALDLHVSKKTIYKHFFSKEDFVESVLYYTYEKLFTAIRNLKPDPRNPLLNAFQLIETIFTHIALMTSESVYEVKVFYPKVWERVDVFRANVIKTMQKYFEQAQQMSLIRKDIDIRLATDLLMIIVQTVFQPEFLIHSSYSLTDMVHLFVDLFLNGIMEKDKTFNTKNLK